MVLDLTEETLEKRYLVPYRGGSAFMVRGKKIEPDQIDTICITFTERSSADILPKVRADRQASKVAVALSDAWLVADTGEDVTDECIDKPPGSRAESGDPNISETADMQRTVFVVHGRDLKLRQSMFAFLRAVELKPLEWEQARSLTKKSTPYVGEILDKAFHRAQAVVVLMAPEDEARLMKEFHGEKDESHETQLTPQPRQNVLFEAGMGMGRDPDRTVLVEVGRLRPFSDIIGRHVVRMDNSTEKRQELLERLKSAGCLVVMDGVDWHTAGDFNRPKTVKSSNEQDVFFRPAETSESVEVTYIYWLDKYTESTGRRLNSWKEEDTCLLPLEDIFRELAPTMLSPARESQMASTVSGIIRDRVFQELRKKHSKLYIRDIRVKENSFQTIKVKLRSMGLIEMVNGDKDTDETSAVWHLTNGGDAYMTRLHTAGDNNEDNEEIGPE